MSSMNRLRHPQVAAHLQRLKAGFILWVVVQMSVFFYCCAEIRVTILEAAFHVLQTMAFRATSMRIGWSLTDALLFAVAARGRSSV